MSQNDFQVRPLAGAAGAEVTGIDLADSLDDAAFAAIEEAFDIHGVLLVRNQNITPSQQIAFAEHFGQIEINYNSAKYGLPDRPQIYVISNVTEGGKPIGSRRAGENWHSDMIYSAKPPRATMLYALEVPALHGLTLGDTAFRTPPPHGTPCRNRCSANERASSVFSTSPAASVLSDQIPKLLPVTRQFVTRSYAHIQGRDGRSLCISRRL